MIASLRVGMPFFEWYPRPVIMRSSGVFVTIASYSACSTFSMASGTFNL